MSHADDVSRALDDDGRPAGTNRSVPPTGCRTCAGDRFVTVRLRSPEQTSWMEERGIQPSRGFHEEVAPCPDCTTLEIRYFVGGRPFRQLDPASVREALRA